jgi:hypothetical protein
LFDTGKAVLFSLTSLTTMLTCAAIAREKVGKTIFKAYGDFYLLRIAIATVLTLLRYCHCSSFATIKSDSLVTYRREAARPQRYQHVEQRVRNEGREVR